MEINRKKPENAIVHRIYIERNLRTKNNSLVKCSMSKTTIFLGIKMELNQAIDKIREVGTNGINYDVETDDIVKRLINWSKRFRFEVLEVDHATVALKLESLPENLANFCQEVYEFCPNTIDQGYDCLSDMIEMAQERGKEIDPAYLELMNGLDPEAQNFGLKLMEKDLPRVMQLTLWWD